MSLRLNRLNSRSARRVARGTRDGRIVKVNFNKISRFLTQIRQSLSRFAQRDRIYGNKMFINKILNSEKIACFT